ncbi:cupin domain-containing protein [Falsibacillus pallidus]|uniref:Uncharacterized protein YjlB n=1 Tax=Falsibacillus pallidus TaxID=493781 RepID=A0A370GQ34_9BACI|nr:cupin domain-containing protein [Falsibacillus pallidus]RDI45822.1 uncharacterized protein YjlB [Falsibacillus pallidus]
MIDHYQFSDDGKTPNHSKWPLLIYKNGLGDKNTAEACGELFESNGWDGVWVNGVYPYHHFHSTAHEVLGVAGGTAVVQMGGENGKVLTVEKGDVIIIPAGVGHKKLEASSDFHVVGAYPKGQKADLLKSENHDHEQAKSNIEDVPLPEKDPVFGEKDGLFDYWK